MKIDSIQTGHITAVNNPAPELANQPSLIQHFDTVVHPAPKVTLNTQTLKDRRINVCLVHLGSEKTIVPHGISSTGEKLKITNDYVEFTNLKLCAAANETISNLIQERNLFCLQFIVPSSVENEILETNGFSLHTKN